MPPWDGISWSAQVSPSLSPGVTWRQRRKTVDGSEEGQLCCKCEVNVKDDAFGDLGGILIWGPIGPKLGDPMCGFLGSHCMVWGYPY